MKSAPISLSLVRTLFNKVDQRAPAQFLLREIAARLNDKLDLLVLQPNRILDAGCGNGSAQSILKSRYPSAQVLGIDAAYNALRQARFAEAKAGFAERMRALMAQFGGAKSGSPWVCGDFAQLPFSDASLELIWSNLALHWHPEPDRVLAEWGRTVKPQGVVFFSCFGPDTFKELRAAYVENEAQAHFLPFVDMHDYGDMLVQAGFATPVMDMEKIVLSYLSVEQLLADVRALGGNPRSDRPRGLTSRSCHKKRMALLEKSRSPSDGRIHLTIEVIYGHAFKPQASLYAKGESPLRFVDLKKIQSDH